MGRKGRHAIGQDKVAEIVRLAKSGLTLREIGRAVHVSGYTAGKYWKLHKEGNPPGPRLPEVPVLAMALRLPVPRVVMGRAQGGSPDRNERG